MMKSIKFCMMMLSIFLVYCFISNDASAQLSKIKDAGAKVTNKLNQGADNTVKAESKEDENPSEELETNLSGKIIYVSKTGSNKNDGSKASPLKNIDKAMDISTSNDKIYVAEGVYMGTFNCGYLQSVKPIQLYGSWNADFTKQDIVNHPTLFQPDNASASASRKALLLFEKEVGGTVIDGIVWDMGERNLYDPKDGVVEGIGGRLRQPTEPIDGLNSTVGEPCIAIRAGSVGGDVTIQNCVFVNGASFGVQIGQREGKVTIKNNVFVANKMAAIEVFGTCAGSKEKKDMISCCDVEISYNTILFSSSRLKDMKDMGYGIRIMTKCTYNIHNNIVGLSVMSAIDNSRFCKDEYVKLDNNILFGNKNGDLEYFPASNVELHLNVDQFEDLEFASVSGNNDKMVKLPINNVYLTAFINATYSEVTNWDPNSAQNQWARTLGMNQQGTMSSSASMHMNKYPWKETLLLFGAISDCGAQ